MSMIQITIGITILNVVILLVLLFIYLQNYREMKANFNLGLVVFATFFTLQKLYSLYFLSTMMKHDDLIGLPMFVIETLETIAFSILLWITVR